MRAVAVIMALMMADERNGDGHGEAMRLDKWLWCASFFKSRSIASEFCETVGVRIGGQSVRKAHYQLRVGDVLTFAPPYGAVPVRILRVRALSPRRLSAPLARELYEDLSPPPPPKNNESGQAVHGEREPGSGRPTKADRRAIARLKRDD